VLTRIEPDRPPAELIATCGSGISATVAMMAVERVGVHCAGVYDGSFNEWTAGPSERSTTAATPGQLDDDHHTHPARGERHARIDPQELRHPR
jgi:hypothetical protein